jgi:transglutaminase-like putative cysteine protease
MRYQISHTTTYSYSQPVRLFPHVVRLRPRCDGNQSLQSFLLQVTPPPLQESQVVDLDGNSTIKVWFKPDRVERLTVQVLSQVETYRVNPFNFLLEPWALNLPIDYPASLLAQLQPYLGQISGWGNGAIAPIAVQLAQEICHQVSNNTTLFLTELNQRIYAHCQHTIRETGDPLPPEITWSQKSGSCRDTAVLFMEVCRAIGLAARFVSGYQEGDPDSTDRHLHAWVEVYLPGAGWCGFDPTHGLVVGDRHIALVASVSPRYAAPIFGAFDISEGARSTITYQLTIQGMGG